MKESVDGRWKENI